MKGLFYNSLQGSCSIWESGRMCYKALSQSDKYTLDYTENNKAGFQPGYDFYIINWHHAVCNWVTDDML
jgi:hypothetical protein